MSKIEHAAMLAALLMNESHWPLILRAATIAPVRNGYNGKHTEEAIGLALEARSFPPHVVARDALALIRIGQGVARRAVAYCNGDGRNREWIGGRWYPKWDADDDARRERADEKALAKASEIAARYGATVKIGGDPRGYVMRLFLASGRSNGMANDGWGVA